jgi:hypothetical protein
MLLGDGYHEVMLLSAVTEAHRTSFAALGLDLSDPLQNLDLSGVSCEG